MQIAVSFSNSLAVYRSEVFLWPVKPTLAGYKKVFNQTGLWTAYGNTIFYTWNFVKTIVTIVWVGKHDHIFPIFNEITGWNKKISV